MGGDQALEDPDAACVQFEIVKAAAILDAAHLDHFQPTPLGAVFLGRALQADHAVGDAVKLKVAVLCGLVVE